MRYFRLENSELSCAEIAKQRKEANEYNMKIFNRAKCTSIIAAIVFFIAFGISLAVNISVMKSFPYNGPSVANFIGKIQMIAFALLSIVFVSIAVSYLIWSKVRRQFGGWVSYKRYHYDEETLKPFREFYGFTESCVVTKCYDSSDKVFAKRDVCIFVADGELRVCANLKYGFSFREKDLGCYAFKPDEISVNLINENNILITELKSNEVSFRLGRRAKSFIEKDFLKQ